MIQSGYRRDIFETRIAPTLMSNIVLVLIKQYVGVKHRSNQVIALFFTDLFGKE